MLRLLSALLALFVASAASAEIRTEVVEYETGGVTFEGHVYWDDAKAGKRPGVLVVHEWWGCNDYARRRASDLAALGYVGFACDMYGKGSVTTDPAMAGKLAGAVKKDLPLLRARAMAGLQQLSGFRFTDSEKLGAIGFCFGGSVVLELARAGADIDAVASFHGGLATTQPAEPGTIKAEVLVLNGAEDPMVSEAERTGFMTEMRTAKARWSFVELGGAVHSFTNPAANAMNNPAVKHDQRAEEQSFGMMRDLFARAFK